MDPRPQTLAPTDAASRWWRWSERMPAALQGPLRSRFFRFLLVGGLNTFFSYFVFALLILARVPYQIAALLATVAGILFNFKSYGMLVFGSHDNRRILRFLGVYAMCYGVGLAFLALGKAHGVSVLVVAALATVPIAGLSFVLCRRFVYGPVTARDS